MLGYVVFKNRDVLIPLERYEESYYLKYGSSKDEIEFPLNVEMQIVFLKESENEAPYFGFKDIVSKKKGNNHHVVIKRTTTDEIKKLLEN